MKVLVVDDQDINRKLPLAILKKQGVATAEAADGEEALALLAREPDIRHILLDVSMPGLSGTEVCQRLRRQANGDRYHIVAYTAHAFDNETRAIMAAGFDRLLIKPINRTSLLQSLGLPDTPAP